jgi:AcrR family transcriptional regulator
MSLTARLASHPTNGLQARAIDAALHLLEAEGARDFNLRTLAEQAGVGVASIYHYFASKDELLLRLALIGFKDLVADIRNRRAHPQGLSPTRASSTAFFAFVEARPGLFSLMFNPRLLAAHEELRRAEQEIFHIYQDALDEDDRVPLHHREHAVFAIWALGRGMAAMMSSYGGALPADKETKLRAGARFLIDRSL